MQPKQLICFLVVSLWMASAMPGDKPDAPNTPLTVPEGSAPDSKQMERDLQRLNWKQFRSVVEAIPKLNAEVNAYGPLGWQFVQANYTHYGWKKSIDKLDAGQKERLAELIKNAKKAQ